MAPPAFRANLWIARQSEIVIHLPWFFEGSTLDGARIDATNGELVVPANCERNSHSFCGQTRHAPMSYPDTVDACKAKYARRYHELMHGSSAQAQTTP
jgi:hypothetical protein